MIAIYVSPLNSCELPVFGFVVVILIVQAFRRRKLTILDAATLTAILTVAIFSVAFPPIARLPREHFGGRDQVEWAKLAKSEDPATRDAAVDALCEILKKRKANSFIRLSSLSGLRAAQSKRAIPALLTLLENDDAQLREDVRATLLEIDPTIVLP